MEDFCVRVCTRNNYLVSTFVIAKCATQSRPIQHMDVSKKAASQQSEDIMQIVVFKLGEEQYGLPIDFIKEVVATPKLIKVPLAPPHIVGIANIRGDILSIVDLEIRFGLGNTGQTNPYTLVLDHEQLKMGILVKNVPQTLNVTESEIDRNSPVLQTSGDETQYISGIIKTADTLIFLIDVAKIVGDPEMSHV